MSLHRSILLALAALSLLALAGCAGRPIERRIERHRDVFETFPPQAQENLRQGIVEIGYTKEMVHIAYGAPHRVITRLQRGGEPVEVWSYFGTYYTTEIIQEPYIYRPYRHHYRFYPYEPVWVDVRREYERLRIEFDGQGQVVALERVQR